MKTTGLNVIEAVKMLNEKRCDGIRNERTDVAFGGLRSFGYADILDTYTLIAPQPLTETVEVYRWEKLSPRGHTEIILHTPITLDAHEITKGYTVVHLTGTYERPIPEPEVVEWEGYALPTDSNEACTIPLKFVGKRVIVRVVEES